MKKFDFNGQKNICGGQIRMLRLCRHMSQITLTIKMQTEGVTMEQDVVSRIESGARLMTDYELRAFAAVLDVPLESLFPPETK